MKRFVRPTIFIKGDRDRGKELLGVARAFLEKTLLWNKQKYFKQGLKLSDGSTIIVQKLHNNEYYTFIETPIVSNDSPLDQEFFLAVDLYTGSDLNHITQESDKGKILLSVNSSGDISSIKAPDTFEAGNIDFKGKYTWHGNPGGDIPIVNGIGIGSQVLDSVTVISKVVESPGTIPGIFTLQDVIISHRYTNKVFSKGLVILDTTVGTNSPGGLVTGFCTNKNESWYVVCIWNLVTGDEISDSIWLLKNNIWTKLGDVVYITNPGTQYMLGRAQGMVFSEDCTKFTCVNMSSDTLNTVTIDNSGGSPDRRRITKSILVDGSIIKDSFGLPISVSSSIQTIDRVLDTTKVRTSNFTGNPYSTPQPSTYTSIINSSLPTSIPIASSFTKNNIINKLSLTKYTDSGDIIGSTLGNGESLDKHSNYDLNNSSTREYTIDSLGLIATQVSTSYRTRSFGAYSSVFPITTFGNNTTGYTGSGIYRSSLMILKDSLFIIDSQDSSNHGSIISSTSKNASQPSTGSSTRTRATSVPVSSIDLKDNGGTTNIYTRVPISYNYVSVNTDGPAIAAYNISKIGIGVSVLNASGTYKTPLPYPTVFSQPAITNSLPGFVALNVSFIAKSNRDNILLVHDYYNKNKPSSNSNVRDTSEKKGDLILITSSGKTIVDLTTLYDSLNVQEPQLSGVFRTNQANTVRNVAINLI